MKKCLNALLGMSLAVCLTACGAPSPTPDTPEGGGEQEAQKEQEERPENEAADISLWTYPVGKWGDSVAVADLISSFNKKYPDIHVSVKYLDYVNGDNEINEAIEAGQTPDLVLEGPERLVANWGDRGLMVDLSDLWSEDATNDIYENVQAASRHRNGEYYVLPICMTTHCMAINYDMFQAADALQYIDEENRSWTTENFVKAVGALKAGGQENVGVIYCGGQGGDQGTRALVNNLYGGTFTNPEHTEYTINSEENIRALELLKGIDGISFAPDMLGLDEIERFCEGGLAMAFCWNVQAEVSQTAKNPEREFDIFPMAYPTSDGTPRLQGGIWGFGIFDNGDEARINASKTFIRFMTEDKEQYVQAVLTSLCWPVRDIEGIYVNDSFMNEYSIFTKYMGDYYQVTPGWAQARTAWWQMLQEVGKGTNVNTAVEGFMDAMQ